MHFFRKHTVQTPVKSILPTERTGINSIFNPMGTKKGIVWALVLLALVSCGRNPLKKKHAIVVQPGLVHPLFFQEEIASQINFPFWFNDSVVRARHIHTIEWTIYRSINSDEDDKREAIPYQTTLYTFDTKGQLTQVKRDYFAEGLTISSKQYAVLPSSGLYHRIKHLQPLQMENEEPVGAFTFMSPIRRKARVLQYDNDYKDTRYHFFPLQKYRGALSVDSIGHPGANDWVIWGMPDKPEKRYQVRNTVTERNVTHYEYLNENYPKMISWSDYPFTQRRYFSYSEKGIFVGFIDSTFIDQQFVTRNVSRIRFGSNHLPSKITHRKGHAESGANYQSTEIIQYTFYP